eukprot:Phypoly_transcript_10793.p1 GENE.Phypoly_transcript_10793~~Phypoly_transcript_10793.p1  ORF type:complete len:309 (+),score=22.83 Phypoly_transcript_10793:243-1169(+)
MLRTLQENVAKFLDLGEPEGSAMHPLSRPLTQFIHGLRLCLRGTYYAITTKAVWRHHSKCYSILITIILCLYVACFLIYMPVFVTLQIAAYFTDIEKWVGDISARAQATQLIANVSFFVPLITVFVTQYLLPNFPDDVFFSTLSVLDARKSEAYRAVPATGFWSILYLRSWRFLRLSFWSLVTYCLSLVPFVGWMVIPIAQFYLVSKIFGYKTAAVFSTVLLIPTLRAYSWPTVKVLFGARALAIEMLEPYFSRFGYDKIKPVERPNQPVLLGFATPFLFLMAVPLVGPLLWGMVQASASVLLLDLEL